MKAPVVCIEPLETRISPAVILNVVTGATGISITEDSANAGDSAVSFTAQANGDLVIDPTDAFTQLRVNGTAAQPAGDPFTVVGFVGGIKAKLGTGDDQATLTGRIPGAVSFDLGPGPSTNGVTLTAASIGRGFSVTAGSGNDTVTFAGSAVDIFGLTKLALGDGANVLANTASTLTTGGDFIATAGSGADDFLLGGSNVVILGKLDFKTGTGGDQAGFDVTGLLQVGTSASLKSGGDIAATTTQSLKSSVAIGLGGKVLMEVKAGKATQSFSSTGGPLVVGGGATFTSGAGAASSVDVQTTSYLAIAGAFTSTTKSTSASVGVTAGSLGGRIGGAFTSKGFEAVAVTFPGAIVGPVKVDVPGESTSMVSLGNLGSTPMWLGAVSITGKAAASSIWLVNTIVQGALKVKTADGTDAFKMDDTLLLASSVVDLGAGADSFFIETDGSHSASGQIFAPVIFKGGAGADAFTFGGGTMNTTLRALAQVTADGGADADTITVEPGVLFIPPLIQIAIP